MAFCILKLSYSEVGDVELVGGICGAGFFIDRHTAITAHHVLNHGTFTPAVGCQNSIVWLISGSGTILRLEKSNLDFFPEIDVVVIRLEMPVPAFLPRDIRPETMMCGAKVRSIGYRGDGMPKILSEWVGDELLIRKVNLEQETENREGSIVRTFKVCLKAADIELRNVEVYQLSFDSIVGMSGSPVIDCETGRIVGMLSFGLPADSSVKDETYAVSIKEIMRRVTNY